MAYTVIPDLARRACVKDSAMEEDVDEGGCAVFDIRCTPGRRLVAKCSRLAPRTKYAACSMTVSVVQHFAIQRPRPARRGVVSSIRTTCKNGPAWSNCRATQAHQGRQRMRGHGVKNASPGCRDVSLSTIRPASDCFCRHQHCVLSCFARTSPCTSHFTRKTGPSVNSNVDVHLLSMCFDTDAAARRVEKGVET